MIEEKSIPQSPEPLSKDVSEPKFARLPVAKESDMIRRSVRLSLFEGEMEEVSTSLSVFTGLAPKLLVCL
jgi:hypothetical protein